MKVIEQLTLHEQTYTLLKETRYLDDRGEAHRWTYIERRDGQQAVVIVPRTERSGSLILIRQYRIPFQLDVLEFPAGLVDPGERPEEAAVRELLEETGYAGRIDAIGPEVSTSAGITTERVHLVWMTVGEQPERPQALEGSERIDVIRVAAGEERSFLERATSDRLILDAKVYLLLAASAGR